MSPSLDSNTHNSSMDKKVFPDSTNTSRASLYPLQAEGSKGLGGVTTMLATESQISPTSRLLRELDASYLAQAHSRITAPDGFASVISPRERQSSTIAPQPSSRNNSRPSPTRDGDYGSLHTTPDSKSGYSSPDDYHGGSDISAQMSASSATDQELFSGSEEDSDSEEDEPSGFEPTEVADILPSAGGCLESGDRPCEFTSDGMAHDAAHSDFDDEDSIDEQYESVGYGKPIRKRPLSYESYPIEVTSPTESQLLEEGFEFHNQLPTEKLGGHFNHEERLLGRFNHEAFQEAIKGVTPEMPRKQQWYTWRKVMEMLERDDTAHGAAVHGDAEHDDLFDDSDLPNDFSLGSLADHSFGGCKCGGDSNKCTCAQDQCSCASCPRSGREPTQQIAPEQEDEDQDVPMNIGYPPITQSFPPILHHPQPSRASIIPLAGDAGTRIPGLEPFEDSEVARMYQVSGNPASHNSAIPNPDCGCQCGSSCQCPAGGCRYDETRGSGDGSEHFDGSTREDFVGFFKPSVVALDARDIWSDAATAGFSSPTSDPREPEARGNGFPQIARALTQLTTFSPGDAPTPAPGFRSQLPSPKRGNITAPIAISRPDTPRPVGDVYDHGIRQSVEPERAPSTTYRESTPAYENRSPSPSPVSHTTASDIEMQDITPTLHEPTRERESSILPDAPSQEPLSPPGSPDLGVAPMKAVPRPHGSSNVPAYSILPPPIPLSPTLNPRKQRATSGTVSPSKRNTKSGVQGSKIAKPLPKSRNVTSKVTAKAGKREREVTAARVKQAVDAIEDSIKRDAEDKQRGISSERLVLQRNGTPPRRSERVRVRSQSPCV